VIDLPSLAIALWQFQVAFANFRLLLPLSDRGSFPVAWAYQVTLAIPVARCGSLPAGRSGWMHEYDVRVQLDTVFTNAANTGLVPLR
jgi:hypothetical protein